ncbi:hypothetical protein BpHYR1_006102 [Brachionus plicatilis]|uniref:Uncharacterized protein n=1 Tax=Brachionus plicatilis TaxID=10195 RepID=A0A3M7SG37_BRAPC|nr:hypothetical protein BpHYR1_006102 [Brachionus plicatilis]
MNKTVNLKIFVANSNVKFILKKKGKISMETYLIFFKYLFDLYFCLSLGSFRKKMTRITFI